MHFFHRHSLVAASLFAIAFSAGCKKEDNPQPVKQAQPSATASAIPAKPVPSFDAQRALAVVDTQVNFGPRVPNGPGHDEEVDWLHQALLQCTPSVEVQNFNHPGYDNDEVLPLSNILASFNPSATWRILIVTHYDSRPRADEDPVEANRQAPIPAANDGASGVAVMLELARAMKDNPPPIGVDLLFDDGEDYGDDKVNGTDWYFLGVRQFMQVKPANYNPRYALLLDMVGDKKAVFAPETNSQQSAPQLVTEIWKVARELNLQHFKDGPVTGIEDDHLPIIQGGIPSVDIIDAQLVGHMDKDPERQYWHTLDDLPKHLSAETLGEVGQLLLTLIYDRFPRDIPIL